MDCIWASNSASALIPGLALGPFLIPVLLVLLEMVLKRASGVSLSVLLTRCLPLSASAMAWIDRSYRIRQPAEDGCDPSRPCISLTLASTGSAAWNENASELFVVLGVP